MIVELTKRYNTRERDIEVTTIAFQRSLTVIIGTLWSAVVSRYWWPFTARRELRMGISECVDLPLTWIDVVLMIVSAWIYHTYTPNSFRRIAVVSTKQPQHPTNPPILPIMKRQLYFPNQSRNPIRTLHQEPRTLWPCTDPTI